MTEYVDGLRTIVETARHHVPAEQLPNAATVGGVLSFCGITLALWGAKLLRPIFALAFVAAGAWFGGEVATVFSLSETLGICLGAIIMGLVGYLLFRFWMAAIAGILVAGIVWCLLMGRVAGPHWQAFGAAREVTEFRVGGTDIVHENGWEAVVVSLQEFWTYLTYKEADGTRRATLFTLAAGLIGFVLGLFSERMIAVLLTSVLGVAMACIGVIVLGLHARPAWEPFLWDHAQWFGVALATLWLGALTVQTFSRKKTVVAAASSA